MVTDRAIRGKMAGMLTRFVFLASLVCAACGASDDEASTGGSGGNGTGGGATCGGEPDRSGEATYYDFADGSGNCGFDATPDDLMVGAMNHSDYAASGACGACAHLVGPAGEVTIRVVDQCPECKPGDIDLSPEAFVKIAALEQGRVPIDWKYVECAVGGPIRYRFKEGSNQWWTALQIRNHRHGIQKVEYQNANGDFQAVNREDYNYFVEPAGMGPGPYVFRVTDVYDNVITDTGIAHQEAAEVPGALQFPACQ
jgi:expansin (peptidoglycan-binding protein)